MIQSFKDKKTEKLFHRERVARFSSIQRVAYRKLTMLDAATRLDDLMVPPANYLEALKGDRKGFYSIRVNRQWRVCFRWVKGNAEDVEIVDYH